MATAKKKIMVRLPKQEGLTFYRRAGLCFARGADNVVEVTPEQLKVLRADTEIAIGDAPPPEEKAKVEGDAK